MAESPRLVRTLAVALTVSLLGNAASTWAQAAPPSAQTAPAPNQAPPPAYPGNAPAPAAPSYPAQQQYQPQPQQPYPQQQQQQQYQPQQPYPQGAPPPAGYTPQQSPLVGQQGYAAQPGYVQPQVQWQPPRRARTHKGLMIAGISVFGASYLLSSFIGSALLDDDSSWDNNRVVGRLLFVPLAGPFAAMSQTSEGDWGLWWLGMAQVAGVGMMIGGIIQYVHSKRRAEAEGFSQWQLPGNRQLSLDMSTSPAFAGPRARLTF